MNRRRFLQLVAAGMTGAAIAPSTLLPPAPDLGRSIQFIRAFRAGQLTRLDILYGWACLHPALAVRITDEDDIIDLEEGDYEVELDYSDAIAALQTDGPTQGLVLTMRPL